MGLEKVKSAINYVAGLLIALLAILLFRQQRKTESAESELATEKANSAVKEIDHDREIAKQEADALVVDYERRKREYDESKLGGDGKL